MKRVALVSEGPSARETYPGPGGYDEVVGVNGVPSAYPCTCWVFLDPEFYPWNLNTILKPRPKIVTSRRLERAINTGRLKAKGLVPQFEADRAAGRVTMTDEIGPLPPMPKEVPIHQGGPYDGAARWDMYGGLAGLVAAWWLGGKGCAIDCYGVDLHGQGDLHGHDDPGRLARWSRERAIFRGLIRGFEAAGEATVTWVAPPRLADWCTTAVPDPATVPMHHAAAKGA